jgi:hypothetical protein
MLLQTVNIFLTAYLLWRFIIMANNFERLEGAVSRVADEVEAVAQAIANPSVDNNDQAVIDDLSSRLEAAADSLRSATEAENAEDSGPVSPTPVE